MTDNNADETAENSKLSRRTALALMGTSAVGGAAASSAFSKLKANRPLNVGVVGSGADIEVAVTTDGSGNNQLELTNNTGSAYDLTVNPKGDVWRATSSGSYSSISGADTTAITGLSGNSSATVKFERFDGSGTVDFDITAYSNTDGLGVSTTEGYSVPAASVPSTNLAHQYDLSASGVEDENSSGGSFVPDQVGSGDLGTESGTGGIANLNATIGGRQAAEFTEKNDAVRGTFGTTYSQPFSVLSVAQFNPSSGDNVMVDGNSSFVISVWDRSGAWGMYAGSGATGGTSDESDPHLFTGDFGGSEILRVDRNKLIDQDLGNNSLDGLTLGNDNALRDNGAVGFLGEVLVYDHSGVSTYPRADAERYLTAKWGL